MNQTDSSVIGTVSFIGDVCLTSGNISGNVNGTTANLVIESGAETVTLEASIDRATKTLAGTLNYQASADAANCMGRTGNFSVTLTTGGAEVTW
jgi:hypothetical protein